MIGPFNGKYEVFSNFWASWITVEGANFPTVEHAFQAAKTLNQAERMHIKLANSPAQAKKRGRAVTLRPDWEEVKVGIMRELLELKFQDGVLRKLLLATGDEELVELNWWHDRFWGVCTGGKRCSCDHDGKNMLGKTLMAVREEIQNEAQNEN